MSNLANVTPAQLAAVPEHLRKYIQTPEQLKSQVGHLDASDLGINILKIVQSNSKEAKRAGWDLTGTAPALAQKTMFLSREAMVLPPGTAFIPLLRTVKYIKWIGRPGEGQMAFQTDDQNDSRIGDGLQFKKDPQTGMNKAPEVTKYINFYVMVQGFNQPVLLSFKRTSTPEGRWLFNAIMMSSLSKNLPMFTSAFILKDPRTVIDGQDEWYTLAMQPAGLVGPESIAKAEAMYETAQTYARISTGAELEDGEAKITNPGPAQQPTQQQTYSAQIVTQQAPAQHYTPPPQQQYTHPQPSTVSETPSFDSLPPAPPAQQQQAPQQQPAQLPQQPAQQQPPLLRPLF